MSVCIIEFAFYIIWKPETIYFIKKSNWIVVGGHFFVGGGQKLEQKTENMITLYACEVYDFEYNEGQG